MPHVPPLGPALASCSLALVLAACGGGGESAPPAPAFADGVDIGCGDPAFRADALRLLNDRRARGADCASEGVFAPAAPLAWNSRLEQAAYAHSADMATHDYFAHVAPDGSTPGDRIDAAGYRWSAVGENIAAGYPDVAAVVDGWISSPGHCANLMSPAFVDAGMACAANAASRYGRYFTLDLAAPR
ncbi:MAG TPA: CAP domain-containing protein [Ideonella sp.]|nr:CAP domain-containing protein [Ideonella sp.]